MIQWNNQAVSHISKALNEATFTMSKHIRDEIKNTQYGRYSSALRAIDTEKMVRYWDVKKVARFMNEIRNPVFYSKYVLKGTKNQDGTVRMKARPITDFTLKAFDQDFVNDFKGIL